MVANSRFSALAYVVPELSDMHDIDPLPLPLYPLDRVVLSLAIEGEDEIRVRPCRSLCRPLNFRGSSWNSSWKGGEDVFKLCGEPAGDGVVVPSKDCEDP